MTVTVIVPVVIVSVTFVPLVVSMSVIPMGTGFGLFGTVGFRVVGSRHGGFLVRFVV